MYRCQDLMDLTKHSYHFKPHLIQKQQAVSSGTWTGEESYRVISREPYHLQENTDFKKLSRKETVEKKELAPRKYYHPVAH